MADEPVVLDTTIGGATTNAYISLAEADSLIHARPFHDAWDDAQLNDDRKKGAIVWATRILSHYPWTGTYVSEDQALPWPRDGVYDHDGRAYPTDDYPEWLKVACAEIALAMTTTDRLADTGTEGYSEIQIDVIKLKVDPNDRIGWIPDYVYDAIKHWFKNQGNSFQRPVTRT